MQIKTVFLDAGGVLVHPNWQRVSDVLAKYGCSVSADALRESEPIVKKRIDTHEIVQSTTDDDRFSAYLRLVIVQAGLQEEIPALALAELYEYNNQWNLWEYVPEEVPTTLAALRERGLTLVVVSNANGTLRRSFERFGLLSAVDFLFDSHEEGIEKPDPEYFRLAMKACGATPETTVHVGDFYHIDVAGARSADIRPILLDAAGLYHGYDCERIRTLSALATIVS